MGQPAEGLTLFLLLSQDWRLARIWLSMAWTHASRSSYVVASKCHVWPVRDTMINSKFSSCSGTERWDEELTFMRQQRLGPSCHECLWIQGHRHGAGSTHRMGALRSDPHTRQHSRPASKKPAAETRFRSMLGGTGRKERQRGMSGSLCGHRPSNLGK